MARRLIDADIADRADGRVPVWRTAENAHVYEDQAGGGAESWETAVADIANKVHRWKFEEPSGTNVNDEIGSLDLTLNGTVNLGQASPLGDAMEFAGGFAESSGLGSLPTGNSARTIVAAWKKNVVGTASVLPIYSYGTATTRQLFQLYGTNIDALRASVATDFVEAEYPVGDGHWHLSGMSYPGARLLFVYQDGQHVAQVMNGDLATSAANNFHVAAEFDDTDPAAITVADVIAFDRGLAKWELDRLYAAFRAALS